MTLTRCFRCRAILFDLDGVLVNSAECVERTWRAWAAKHGLELEKVMAMAHGRRTIETIKMVAPGLSADAEAASLESREEMTSEGVYKIDADRSAARSISPRSRKPLAKWSIRSSRELGATAVGSD